MAEDHGISHHLVLQDNPPDILLTNYKMLDYLLIRPQDQRLWRFNLAGVLRYLVLDELHTYDGAQGADVACLIRRLKERLEIPKGGLCIVGTSATLDDREPLKDTTTLRADGSIDAKDTSTDRLARFASSLFEEDVPAEAVIGEDRLTVEEIVHAQLQDVELPSPTECEPRDDEDALATPDDRRELWHGTRLFRPADSTTLGRSVQARRRVDRRRGTDRRGVEGLDDPARRMAQGNGSSFASCWRFSRGRKTTKKVPSRGKDWSTGWCTGRAGLQRLSEAGRS